MTMNINNRLILLVIGVIVSATSSCAFTVFRIPSVDNRRHQRCQRPVTPLFVVADAEDISKNRRRNDGDDDTERNNYNYDDSWIPTASGGFLPNFSRRLRKIVTVGRSHDATDRTNQKIEVGPGGVVSLPRPQTKSSTPNKVHEVLSLQDYKTMVVDEKESIVVVRFYASWCRACKAVSTRFRQQLPRKFPNVKFVEVPLTKENTFLHEGLGVPSLPYAHIYHPDVGLVEELKINQHVFSDFVDVLQTYTQGHCDIVEDELDGQPNSSE